MLVYCDLKCGSIGFAEKKPRGAMLIAEHPDGDVLHEAVICAGVSLSTTWSGGKKLDESLNVPWYETAKDPIEEEDRVRLFSEKVERQLEAYSERSKRR